MTLCYQCKTLCYRFAVEHHAPREEYLITRQKTGLVTNVTTRLMIRSKFRCKNETMTEIWKMWLEFRPIRQTNTTCDRNFGTRKEKQKREI